MNSEHFDFLSDVKDELKIFFKVRLVHYHEMATSRTKAKTAAKQAHEAGGLVCHVRFDAQRPRQPRSAAYVRRLPLDKIKTNTYNCTYENYR
jgi:hypothetical protein